MGIFWSFLKPYKKEAILSPLFKWFEALTQLVVPLFIAQMVDQGILQHNHSVILREGILLLIFALLGVFFSVIAQFFSAKAAVGFASSVRSAFFQKVNALSLEAVSSFGSSTLVSRFSNDINLMQTGLNVFLRLFLRSPFLVLGTMVASYRLHPEMGVRFSLLATFLLFLIFLLLLFSLPFYTKVQEGMDQLTKLATDALAGVRVLRSFNQAGKQVARFKSGQKKLTRTTWRVTQLTSLLNPTSYLVLNVGLLLILYRAGQLVDLGGMTQGQVVAMVNYLTQILIELMKIATCVIAISRGIIASHRVKKVLTYEEKRDNASTKDALQVAEFVSLTFDHVSYTYPGGGEAAINDFSFTFLPGQSIGIIGGTGAGKSTLALLLANLIQPTSGRILLNGKDLRTLDSQTLSRYTSIVLQQAVLFQGTVGTNLHATGEEKAYQALTAAQATFIPLTPEGLNQTVSAGGKNFSGGQRQRLSIARSLCQDKPILVLDDSLSALDNRTAHAVNQAIDRWPLQLLVRISQRLQVIQDAPVILVMDHGRLIASGSHEELLATCALYQEIAASQQQKEAQHV